MAKAATMLSNLRLQINNSGTDVHKHTQSTIISTLFSFKEADNFQIASTDIFYLMNLPNWKMKFYYMDRNLQSIGIDCNDIRLAPGLYSEQCHMKVHHLDNYFGVSNLWLLNTTQVS